MRRTAATFSLSPKLHQKDITGIGDNWYGHQKEFPSLKARKAAKKETGVTVTIYCNGKMQEHAPASGFTPA